jgi:hypothetical protein
MVCQRTVIAFLMAVIPAIVPASSSAETKIVTGTGEEYVGEVIDVGVNTLKMKLAGTGYQIVPVQSVDLVEVVLADGTLLEGKLIDWHQDELVLRVGDRDFTVSDGLVMSVVSVDVPVGGPSQPVESEPSPSEEPPQRPKNVPSNATM